MSAFTSTLVHVATYSILVLGILSTFNFSNLVLWSAILFMGKNSKFEFWRKFEWQCGRSMQQLCVCRSLKIQIDFFTSRANFYLACAVNSNAARICACASERRAEREREGESSACGKRKNGGDGEPLARIHSNRKVFNLNCCLEIMEISLIRIEVDFEWAKF